jgi:hypothetical protein
MNSKIVGCVLVATFAFMAQAHAQTITLRGNTKSKVTARVFKPDNLIVTGAEGGLVMQQFGGWDTPYEVSGKLRVESSSGIFQVKVDSPLEIRHQTKPEQIFRTPSVRLGLVGEALKPLLVGQYTEFHNPPATVEGEDSRGEYDLAVSAYPPEGNFKNTSGTYSGILSLTFEPVVREP